jgi:hypothetical protein
MVARVASTLGGVLSTKVAVVSNPVGALQPVGVVLRVAAWGKEAVVEVMASAEAVDIKVLDNLALAVILFKVNQVGRQQVGILQVLEMTIGGGITTIHMVIIEQTMGVISRGGVVRIIEAGEVLFSHVSEILLLVRLLDQLMQSCFSRRCRPS